MQRIILGVFLSVLLAPAVFAAGYDEFYVTEAKSILALKEVEVLRTTAFEAARRGEVAKLQLLFADQVSFYDAPADPVSLTNVGFKVSEVVGAENVIVKLAGPVANSAAGKPSQKQLLRSGLFVFSRLLRDPVVGTNFLMNGAICNRPVRLAKQDEFAKALVVSKSKIANWVVAKMDMGPSDSVEAPGQYPTKIFKDQMVLKTNETHGDKRWSSIAAPDGGETLFYKHPQSYSIAPFFTAYVAEHVCFGQKNGRWKITAIALRVN